MQRLAGELLEGLYQGRARSRRDAEAAAIDRVPHQRVVDVGHVHADLVRAAGLQLDPGVGVGAEPLQHAVVADGLLATGHHAHALALLGAAADGRVDLATGGDHTDDDGLIDAADGPGLQLGDQLGVGLEGLGHHHQAGGVLVEAMHDAGPGHVGQVGGMVQQGVEQGAVHVAGRRVHHQAGGLVQHQQVVVLVDDVQLDVLGHPLTLGLQFGIERQHGTAIDGVAGAEHLAVHGESPFLDPGGQAGAGVFVEELCGNLVQALPAQIGRHLGTQLDGLFIGRGHARKRRGAAFGFGHALVVKYGVFVLGKPRAPIITGRLRPRQRTVTGTQATMQVKHLLLIAILALTAACSSKEVVDENLSESELYQQAQSDLDNKSYSSAVAKLKALESRYPFGRYAEQAQLELIYAYYKNVEPEAAKSAAERFIRLHPQHANVDYAYYLKGLASFEQDRGLLARFLPLDMTKRDPGAARDSYNEFAQLTSRYPHSRYAPDAKQRMVYLRNLLAAYEIHVAHYYLTRQAYVAAGNRGRYVVENFQGTPAVGDGLAVMVESYQRLGLDDLAATSLETLKLNYPEHPSLVDGQFVPREDEADNRSWLAKATLGLIESEAPLPPGQTRANQDVIKQYEDAKEEIPDELQPENASAGGDTGGKKRSWFSYMTFGLFD